MLADQLDYVIGVDPHSDTHALAIVEVRTGGVVFETSVAASSGGYARALELADEHAQGRRAFAIEGTGSFGAGLTRFLGGEGERVLEVGGLRRERRSGGKSDALDAIRAARSVRRLVAVRPERRRDVELRGALLALRALARRVKTLTVEERQLAGEIETLTRRLAPQLLDQPGVGPLAAAQILISWSHPGRIRSEAAFARLAGCAPIPASSGQTVRFRLDRSGDRGLNRALHMILVTRRRAHPPTIAYIERRIQEGKSRREASRCPQALPGPQPLPATAAPGAASGLTGHRSFIAAHWPIQGCSAPTVVGAGQKR